MYSADKLYWTMQGATYEVFITTLSRVQNSMKNTSPNYIILLLAPKEKEFVCFVFKVLFPQYACRNLTFTCPGAIR